MPVAEVTLAHRLGIPTHVSSLLRKARRLGLATPRELCTLAVQRGCRHYAQGDEPAGELVSRSDFSDEELAVALLDVALPYEPRAIRCGAAMLSAPGSDPRRLAWLARLERSEIALRHVAGAGRKFEPENPFWIELLDLLPDTPTMPDGVLLHPTRFVAMTGIVRRRPPGLYTEWQRPGGAPTVSHAQS